MVPNYSECVDRHENPVLVSSIPYAKILFRHVGSLARPYPICRLPINCQIEDCEVQLEIPRDFLAVQIG